MNEIKFRQRNGDTWHYWGFIDGGFVAPCRLDTPSDQYINLKDRNGREIYEGDIVLFDTYTWIVAWGEVKNGWVLKDDINALPWIDMDGLSQYEIIGNIHENPELISNL